MELLIAFIILFIGVIGGIIWYLIAAKRELEEYVDDLRFTITNLKSKLRKKGNNKNER